MEEAPAKSLYAGPRHPYSRALLSAAPEIDPAQQRERIILEGDLPSPLAPPSGCVFRTRCPHAVAACAATVPALEEVAPGHRTACLRDDIVGRQPGARGSQAD
jgi:peptide/nickel transport system ATP-binding protein